MEVVLLFPPSQDVFLLCTTSSIKSAGSCSGLLPCFHNPPKKVSHILDESGNEAFLWKSEKYLNAGTLPKKLCSIFVESQ